MVSTYHLSWTVFRFSLSLGSASGTNTMPGFVVTNTATICADIIFECQDSQFETTPLSNVLI